MHSKIAALGSLCLVLAGLHLTGCEKAQEAPAKGEVIVGTYSKPAPFDPLKTRGTISTALVDFVYNHLAGLNEKLEPVPELAESWEIKENGLRWVLHLRKGVLFHDGEELEAEDVVFTYKTIQRLRTEEFENLKDMWERDRYTVEIALKEPDAASLLYWLRIPIVSRRSYAGAESSQAIGTGPFQLKAWMVNHRIVFEANRDYFEGEPGIRRIVVQIYEEYEMVLSAFLRGEVDIPFPIKAADVRLIENNPKFQVLSAPSPLYYTLLFNLRDPLLKEKMMRQALCYAINREELLRTALKGRGTLAHSPFPSPTWTDTSAVEKYDPGTAERLSNELGWRRDPTDGFFKKGGRALGFQLTYPSGDPLFKKIADSLWLQFQRAGIKIELASAEGRDLIEKQLRPLKYQLAVFQYNMGLDPDFASHFLTTAQIGDYNLSGYTNETVDNLFALGRVTFDIRERKRIYRKIEAILEDERPIFPLVFPGQFAAARSRVENFWYLKGEGLLRSARYWRVRP